MFSNLFSILLDIIDELIYCLKPQTIMLSTEEKKIVKQIEEKGFCVLQGFYTKEQCAELRDMVDSEMASSSLWIDEHQSDHRIYGINELDSAFQNYLDNDLIQNIGKYYTKSTLQAKFTLAGKLIAQGNNLGSGGGWHRDTPVSRQFKSLIYLSDVSDENGPFQYIPMSHKKQSSILCALKGLNHFRQRRYSEENIQSIEETMSLSRVSVVGQAGDIVLVDVRGLHRGKPISQGTRYALTNYFWSKKIPQTVEKYLVKKS